TKTSARWLRGLLVSRLGCNSALYARPLPSIPPIRVQSAVLAGGALGVVSAEAKASPLILDIDQSGTIDLISLHDTRTYWDIDEDGFAELSGWVQPQDGLLAYDMNLDGIVNDHSELFGSATVDGFTELRVL